MNIYYIIKSDDIKLLEIINCVVGDLESQRYSLDKSKLIVKTKFGCFEKHECLEGYKGYTLDEILKELDSVEWSNGL